MGEERLFSHTFKCELNTANAIKSYKRYVDELPAPIAMMPPDDFRNKVIRYIYDKDPLMVLIRRLGASRSPNGSMFKHAFSESAWDLLNSQCHASQRISEFAFTEYCWRRFVESIEVNRCLPEDFLVY